MKNILCLLGLHDLKLVRTTKKIDENTEHKCLIEKCQRCPYSDKIKVLINYYRL